MDNIIANMYRLNYEELKDLSRKIRLYLSNGRCFYSTSPINYESYQEGHNYLRVIKQELYERQEDRKAYFCR